MNSLNVFSLSALALTLTHIPAWADDEVVPAMPFEEPVITSEVFHKLTL
jgi:hypothetical protein